VPGSPAERAGMQRGDVVLTLAGEPVVRTGDVRRITEANLGKTIPMEVRRGDSRPTLEVTPRTQWPEGDGPLGVGILDGPAKVEPVRYTLPEAAVRGVRELGRSIVLTLSVPVLALQGLVPLEFLRPVGPVGLFQATSQAAAETARSGWWFPILYMGASLGAGLAVANLLPIPGLDGGRLVFILIEAIRGRRIAPEREGLIHLVGMAVLVSLVIVITYFDILFPVAVDFTLR